MLQVVFLPSLTQRQCQCGMQSTRRHTLQIAIILQQLLLPVACAPCLNCMRDWLLGTHVQLKALFNMPNLHDSRLYGATAAVAQQLAIINIQGHVLIYTWVHASSAVVKSFSTEHSVTNSMCSLQIMPLGSTVFQGSTHLSAAQAAPV